ncbi:hypothetical protein Salat_1155200 [Sesamum alatum]|uniref:Uncharacterized protein n=1 Tax=Sesamum alatum TaxID=300844 RepID=A0AAE2CNN8_9LAMI|nr:hypothetical protein Salat_1155200 [Sesamum alatum]
MKTSPSQKVVHHHRLRCCSPSKSRRHRRRKKPCTTTMFATAPTVFALLSKETQEDVTSVFSTPQLLRDDVSSSIIIKLAYLQVVIWPDLIGGGGGTRVYKLESLDLEGDQAESYLLGLLEST